ncbi:MAG: hypothetical protein KC478_14080 [Bacteriovoracaceae bacterium]|nr:hypothetical protein [Bacteriovoracaceae bacterium]
MNSKNTLVFALLIFLSSCGVKTSPSAPKNTALPSIPEGYMFKFKKAQTIQEDEEKDDLEQKDK